jgi:hypothetical protein
VQGRPVHTVHKSRYADDSVAPDLRLTLFFVNQRTPRTSAAEASDVVLTYLLVRVL